MRACFFEGHIRNRLQLCEELSIDPASPQNDELSLLEAAFGLWGSDIGNHLRGSFSFAIMNETNGELFCARDPLGIEPFYYRLDVDGALRYGSDIETVVYGMERREIDLEALQRYFMLGYPAGEKTLYDGVWKLMPGHYLIYDGTSILTRPYHTLSFSPDYSRNEAQWVADIERTLDEILEEDAAALESGGSCAFLSSGVDSSYLLAKSGAKHAYSIGYAEESSSEAREAAATARQLGVEFSEVEIDSNQYFDAIPRVIHSAGMPLADASTVALLIGCESVANDGSCCLSGEGADELFAGYHLYRRANTLGKTGGPWYFGCSRIMRAEDAQRLLMLERSYPMENLVKGIYEATESCEHLSRLQAIDCALFLEGDILLGAHAASRASGLRLLLPYADQRMVTLAARIPASYKLREGCGKYVLRKAAQGKLPHEVAFRRKIGFSVPIRAWMREPERMRDIESMLFDSDVSSLFDMRMVEAYWRSFVDGNEELWHIIYALYVFLIWYRECFTRRL